MGHKWLEVLMIIIIVDVSLAVRRLLMLWDDVRRALFSSFFPLSHLNSKLMFC